MHLSFDTSVSVYVCSHVTYRKLLNVFSLVVGQSFNVKHIITTLRHTQAVTLFICLKNFNSSCNLEVLDYITLIYVHGNTPRRSLPFTQNHKVF